VRGEVRGEEKEEEDDEDDDEDDEEEDKEDDEEEDEEEDGGRKDGDVKERGRWSGFGMKASILTAGTCVSLGPRPCRASKPSPTSEALASWSKTK